MHGIRDQLKYEVINIFDKFTLLEDWLIYFYILAGAMLIVKITFVTGMIR